MRVPDGIAIGQTFTRWRVLGTPQHVVRSGVKCWKVQCQCAVDLGGCGTIKLVAVYGLTHKTSHSCGCLRRNREHGGPRPSPVSKRPSPEILTWRGIINRCYNETNSSYQKYGARGIYVCDGWRNDRHKFVSDMGPRPSPQHSIDRKDSTGPYSCGVCEHCIRVGATLNCRWATPAIQANNVSRNRVLTYNGETMTVTDWTKRIGCSPAAIYGRLDRGWTVEQALGTPLLGHGLKRKYEEVKGTMSTAAPDHHVSLPTKQRNPNPRKPWKHVVPAE